MAQQKNAQGMKLWAFLLASLPGLLLLAASCTGQDLKKLPVTALPSATAHLSTTPTLSPTETAIPPTATLLPRAAAEPTARPPTPTAAPYARVPEQIDDGWQTASLVDAGLNPVWITKMLDAIDHGTKKGRKSSQANNPSLYRDIHSILIVKDGRLVFEEYFYYHHRGKRHGVASITKSFTSLLTGLAIEQGFISGVGEKVLPYFPEYLPLQQPDQWKEDMTIEDLLTMRHGWECDERDPDSIAYSENDFDIQVPDLIEATLDLPMETFPGSHFSYCTPSTVVLGGVLKKATGMEVPKYAQEKLFDPLGINTAVWTTTRGDWTNTGGGVLMLPRDMAKIGLLLAQNGIWNGEQIISEDWIQSSIQEQVTLESELPSWGKGYGYLWWLGDIRVIGTRVESVCALGGWQQVIAIFPELEMVVVITGADSERYAGQPYQILEKFILPAALGY